MKAVLGGLTGMGLAIGGLLAGCGLSPSDPVTDLVGPPVRIVSLDYCADQYVLKFADPDRIRAVSPDADQAFSYMAAAAEGIPSVRPIAEDVLLLRPDLVVRAYGGGAAISGLFDAAGIPVLQIGFANSVEDIKAMTVSIAEDLGAPEKGQQVVADMDRRLGTLASQAEARSVLYMTPGGVTSGPGSLVHDMIGAAGLRNFETRPGWHPLPLETLVRQRADLIAAAFYDSHRTQPHVWSAARHPIARAQLAETPVVPLRGAWTACGGWFMIEAIEALAEAGLDPQHP
jgi:iron complex transport system substrate-binding protein